MSKQFSVKFEYKYTDCHNLVNVSDTIDKSLLLLFSFYLFIFLSRSHLTFIIKALDYSSTACI